LRDDDHIFGGGIIRMPWSEIFCKPRYKTAKKQVLTLLSWILTWNGTPVGCCMVASPFKRERGG
jgi:hypothetical protein